MNESRSAVSYRTARYGRYVLVRQQTGTQTACYWAMLWRSPISNNKGLFLPRTARNWSVTVDFDRCHPLPSGISLVAAWLRQERGRRKKQGRKKRKREKKRETSVAGEPRDGVTDEENLMRRQLLRRCLLLVIFSSEATRKRGGLCDIVEAFPHLR
ncbi:hypothetical protein GW17_00000062 [Ensete ventricosum]|nr:hypothetical protein GW17_00000062 [Ensete ventricosum]